MSDADPTPENVRRNRPDPALPDTQPGKPTSTHDMPAAGPHAQPDLTAPEKTPGAGSLPDPDDPQEGDATTG